MSFHPQQRGQDFSRQTTTTSEQMAPLGAFVEAAWVAIGCSACFGDFYKRERVLGKKPSLAILATARLMARITWQLLTQHRAYARPCSRPNTSEASLPSVLPAWEAWPRSAPNRSKIVLEEDCPQPLQNNAGWSLSPKALMTHLLIGWRAGDLIVINGRGPARPAPQRSVVIPSSALQTHSG